ncbi:MAG TPA: hypothetical protein VG013_33160 [Gemmataceae bacterium]|jgi:hypothetical protein|nr:hypothetical protein [Gemmataceae bacterium]
MPPRSVTAAIVVFWLATSGWLFYRDLWPRWRPDGRPPYSIDLAQEPRGQGRANRWDVYRNGQTIGHALTWVDTRQDGTYEVNAQFWFDRFKFTFGILGFTAEVAVQQMNSVYRVTRDGALRAASARVVVALTDAGGTIYKITALAKGRVEDGLFTPHWRVESPWPIEERTTEPVEVPAQYSMLSPLQPWNRLLDLQENQQWRITLFDPLTESLAHLVPGKKTALQVLQAGVLQGTQPLIWNSREVACLVIEYRGDNYTARTWVRKSDGLVLRQEAERPGERYAMERAPQ